ncbi:hypothetical protein DFJ74DRAFT_774446 [Hyaloraphidium curvatum]|nr:hypothetical protein DFJ74DRAFT_774446 [Hyaloraphidium curvatum]
MAALPGDASGTDLSALDEAQQRAIRESHAILDLFMDSFNKGDRDGLKRAFTWPTVRIASGAIKVFTTVEEVDVRGQQAAGNEAALAAKGFPEWGHSEWVYRKAVQVGKDKVHWDCCFRRLNKEGKETGRFVSVYIVAWVEDEKRWGIQGRSSFAP